MYALIIVILLVAAAGVIKYGFLPLLFVIGGAVYLFIQKDKSGGESIFPWLGAFALVVGIGSLVV